MLPTLRTKFLIALSLTCIPITLACKKDDADATGVDDESVKKKKPKPEPVPAKEKSWVVEGSPTIAKHCSYARFCTTKPQITHESDAGALRHECGDTVKIPESVVIKGFENAEAWLKPTETEKARETEPTACCYGYQTGPCGKGRPLRDGDELVLAPEIASVGWQGADVAAAAAEVRASGDVEAFVAHFRRIARLEHGSVAAFAVVSLDLLALGAPADLIERAHGAALDEIRHARVCWSLVEALTGVSTGPGPMTLPDRKPVDRERILVETIVEGCIGETLGSLNFAEEASRATPALAAIYRTIADEEASHAELAFRIVKFLIEQEPRLAAVAREVAETTARGPERVVVVPVINALTMERDLVQGTLRVEGPPGQHAAAGRNANAAASS